MVLTSLFKNTNPTNLNMIVSGDDAFLNDYLIRSYINNDQFFDYEKITVDCESDGLDELIASLTESSLFSTKKIIRINKPFFLLNKSIKKYQKNIQQLTDIIEHLADLDDIIVINASYEKIDRRKKITKLILRNFNVVTPQIKPYEVASVTKAIIKNQGYTISQSALQLLVERSDQVLDTILSNFEKLKVASLNNKITEELVTSNVDISLDQNIFAILESAFKKNYVEAISRLDNQLREGSNPVQLLAVFENQIELLLVVKTLAARKRSENDIVKELGVHPYRVKLALQNRISVQKLKVLLKNAILLDYNYKNGNYRSDNFLRMFILEI